MATLIRIRLIAVLVILCLAAAPRAEALDEYDVKAAYLFNFLQFVTWPPMAFGPAGAPVRLCVVGRNPFGDRLQSFTSNERAAGRPIEVVTVPGGEAVRRCHVAYLADGTSEAETLRTVATDPVLTVGESAGFLASGGMIRLAIVNSRVRFDVNVAQASTAGLVISSRLLQVAREVR